MFIWTARLSKKWIFCLLLAALAAAALIFFLFNGLRSDGGKEEQLTTNEDRISYLQSWGWEVNAEPVETFQLLLPEKLQEPYLAYNELQKEQNFDLSDYCGKQVIRYTYTVTNYPDRPDGVQVNLYLCDSVPVAGDIIAAGKDGFQAGLAFPKASSVSEKSA
jgi:hypothetical protein